MLRTYLLAMLIVCLMVTAAAQAARADEVLPAGTLLQCTLDEPNFSSRTGQIDDPVLCHLGAVVFFGHSLFPRGAYLAGRFRDYRDPGHFFGKGWIELVFDRLVLPGAVTVPLSAKVISLPRLRADREGKIQGRGHPKRDALGWAIPVLWPVKILTLPARGPRPTLKGEVRITLRLLEDVDSRNSHGLQNPILNSADLAVETRQQKHTLASTVVCRFYIAFGGKPNGGVRIQAARDYEIQLFLRGSVSTTAHPADS